MPNEEMNCRIKIIKESEIFKLIFWAVRRSFITNKKFHYAISSRGAQDELTTFALLAGIKHLRDFLEDGVGEIFTWNNLWLRKYWNRRPKKHA